MAAVKYNNGSCTANIVVFCEIILATYKLPPTHTSLANAAPPCTVNAPPLLIAVEFVVLVNVTAPPAVSVLFSWTAPPMVVPNAIFAAPPTLMPPFGTTIAPVPCVVVAILALAHKLLAAVNVVNAPVLAVALPIGVELIAAN